MKETKLQKEIFREIVIERHRQEAIHGENSIVKKNPLGFESYAVLGEEVGEVGRALLDCSFDPNFPNTARNDLERELIQVAAVAVAWLEALEDGPDRN